MPYDTRTLPGTIRRGRGGEEVASGWCIIAFDIVGQGKPLADWRGEMACTNPEQYQAAAAGGDGLYIEFQPYGGVFEPWHGPVSVEPVDSDNDPNRRRLRLRAAGPLTRSVYYQEAASDNPHPSSPSP